MKRNLLVMLSIVLMLLAFISCTNDNSSKLPDTEASAVAEKIDPVQLMNDALKGKISGATVTFRQVKDAATLIAVVEFDNATYNGFKISSGRLSYTLVGDLTGSSFRATSYKVTTEVELSIAEASTGAAATTLAIEVPETTTASTGSSVTATVTANTEGEVKVSVSNVSISLPSTGAQVTVGGNDVTETVDPEPEKPPVVKYVTVTLTIPEGESSTASVVEGSTYTFSAPADVPEGKAFISWSDAEGTEYLVGETIIASSDMSFTANLVDETVYARFNGTEYPTLVEALDAAKGQGSESAPALVELLRSVPNGSGYSFADGQFNVIIDLRGNTYTFYDNSVGSTGTESQGFQILKDNVVTIKNGTLNVAEIKGTNGNFKMVIQNYSDLTLDSVVVDGTNLLGTGQYTISNNYGDSVFAGDTIVIAQEGGIAFDVYYVLSSTYKSGVSVTIKDSSVSIEGPIEYAHTSDTEETFREKSHLIVPEGYQNGLDVSVTNYVDQYDFTWESIETGYVSLSAGSKK